MNGIGGYNVYQKGFFDANGAYKKDAGKSQNAGQKKNTEDLMSSAVYEKRSAIKENTYPSYDKSGMRTDRSQTSDKLPQLSEAATKLLSELREKYSNMDIFVGDTSSDEFAQRAMASAKNEYSLIIDAKTLEAMAADEETKNTYIGYIDDATSQLSNVKEELAESENGKDVESISISIDPDGKVSFMAKLREGLSEAIEAQKERIDKRHKEKAEKEKVDKAKAEKEKLEKEKAEKNSTKQPGIKDSRTESITATSVAELIDKIKSFTWGA